MKKVTIYNKNGSIESPDNLKLEEELDSWIAHCKELLIWGKNERWVREFSEEYSAEDVLDTKVELENSGDIDENGDSVMEEVTYVLLRADYTIEINEYFPPVPEKLTRRQALLAMLEFGILDDVEAFINLPETDRKIKIEFNESQDFHRNWEALNLVATQMGITQEQIDQMFRLGITL